MTGNNDTVDPTVQPTILSRHATRTPVAESTHHYYSRRDREASTFSGKRGDDPDAWILEYQRVSDVNGWDDSFRLANVIFYLSGTAKIWFENHEDDILSWDEFKKQLTAIFGNTHHRRKEAESILATRAQLSNESCTDYIENILKLCRIINPEMPENEKVGHLLKGIAEDVFNFITLRDVSSVRGLTEETRKFEALRRNRIAPPAITRLPNVVPTLAAVHSSAEDLESLIRRIVRDEVQAALRNPAPGLQATANVHDIVQTEVQRVMSSMPSPTASQRCPTDYNGATSPAGISYSPPRAWTSNYVQPYRPEEFSYNGISAPRQSSPYFGPGRTADDRPICFGCGRVGHIRRYCRSSNGYWNSASGQTSRSNNDRPPTANAADRSFSPNRRSSRRQSLSPPPAPSPRNRTPSPSSAYRPRSPAGNE